ncbi:MAG: hypothetical protein MUO73_03775 [Thermoplasmata archaeon]|nr:hypothetical protein [Thermoplasmata archaeon]
MSGLLDDELNLQLLSNICSGVGVHVNINELSRIHTKYPQNILLEHVLLGMSCCE